MATALRGSLANTQLKGNTSKYTDVSAGATLFDLKVEVKPMLS